MYEKHNKANTATGLYQNSDTTSKSKKPVPKRSGTGEDKEWKGDRKGEVIPEEKQPVAKVFHKNAEGKIVEYPSVTYTDKPRKLGQPIPKPRPVIPKKDPAKAPKYGKAEFK